MSGPNAVWPDGTRWAVGQAHDQWMKRSQFDPTSVATDILTALEPFVQQRIEAATRALDDDCRSLRDLQSWVADAVGLAPYMGCYVQEDVLPSVRRVVIERDALRAEVARLREDGERVKRCAETIVAVWGELDGQRSSTTCMDRQRFADLARALGQSVSPWTEEEIDAARSARGGEG